MGFTELLIFIVGAGIGAAVCYVGLIKRHSESAVGKQMKELQEEFTAYRENVNQHFNQTAQLVNNLTRQYSSVQKHLEEAAVSFAAPPKSFDIDNTESPAQLTHTAEQFEKIETNTFDDKETKQDAGFSADKAFQPPRDYAPKNTPNEKGTLAEDFGLQDKQ